ncbi:hypothetical protein NMY22_g11779 [Coprinellus aureogranulatus]|nr:hypothetical protein NMY22_g11779 [Coprinellus aureogranulatus]
MPRSLRGVLGSNNLPYHPQRCSILAAADDAHARYAAAVEEWRDMLRGLHALEEEVGSVIRDREILVTRLIKASKSSKPSSSHPRTPSSSSLNLAGSYRTLAPTTTKLAAAQSELQACETHLAAKERELEVRRIQVIRDGLTLRARAMAETGRAWQQLGREAVEVVERELGMTTEQDRTFPPGNDTATVATHATRSSSSTANSPPGGYPTTSSDEGSAHQVQKAGELRIPAAHAISSEIGMPIPFMDTQAPLSRRSSVVSGPPVPSKRDSMFNGSSRPASRIDDGDQHQHRPHLHHVAPRSRVSWVSVTDTEEDWVDARDGQTEELDVGPAFGATPRQHNGDPSLNTETSNIVTVPKAPAPQSSLHSHSHSNPNLATSDQDKDLPAPPPLAAPALYPFVSAPGSIFDSEEYKQAQAMSTSRPTSLALPSSSTPHPRPLSTSPEITVSPPPGLSASQDRDDDDEDRREEGRESRGSQGSGTSIPAAVSEVEFVGSATRHRFESDVPAVVKTSPVTEHHPASVLTHPNPEPQSTERSTDPETPPLQPPALWLQPSSTQRQPHAEEPSLKEAQESIPDVVRQSASPSLRLVTAPREAREATKVQEAPPSSYTGTAHVLARKITEESMSAVLASGPSFLGAPVARSSSVSGGALAVDREDGENGTERVIGGGVGEGEGELIAVESTVMEVVPKPEGGVEVREESVEVKLVKGKEPEVVTDEDDVVEDEEGNRFKVVENPRFSSAGKGEGATTAAAVPAEVSTASAMPEPAPTPAVPVVASTVGTAEAAPVVAATITTTTTTAPQSQPLLRALLRTAVAAPTAAATAAAPAVVTQTAGPATAPLQASVSAPIAVAETTTTTTTVPATSNAEEPIRVHEVTEEVVVVQKVEPSPTPVPAPAPAPQTSIVTPTPAPAPAPAPPPLPAHSPLKGASPSNAPITARVIQGFLGGLRGFFGADLDEGAKERQAKGSGKIKGKKKGSGSEGWRSQRRNRTGSVSSTASNGDRGE